MECALCCVKCALLFEMHAQVQCIRKALEGTSGISVVQGTEEEGGGEDAVRGGEGWGVDV